MITHSLAFVVLLNKTPMELFVAGRIMMWPILLLFTVGLTVIIERILFIIRENAAREPEVVAKMLELLEKGEIEEALAIGKKSNDTVARIVTYSLSHREALSNAFFRASGQELARYQQGMATLDTCITAAPLLGLLGTVTGMMAWPRPLSPRCAAWVSPSAAFCRLTSSTPVPSRSNRRSPMRHTLSRSS
jgi:biopolymer transport protein ExbB